MVSMVVVADRKLLALAPRARALDAPRRAAPGTPASRRDRTAELAAVAAVLRGEAGAVLVRCAWCGRLELPGSGGWVTPVTPQVLRPAPVVARATTHGICPSCLETVQQRAAFERARRRSYASSSAARPAP